MSIATVLLAATHLALSPSAAFADTYLYGSDEKSDVTTPAGDIVSTRITNRSGNVQLNFAVAYNDRDAYTTLPGWANAGTVFGWELDTTGDGRSDFDVRSENQGMQSGLGVQYARLFKHGTDESLGTVAVCLQEGLGNNYGCTTDPAHSPGVIVVFPASLIGSPATIQGFPTFQWDNDAGAPGANVTYDVGHFMSGSGAWMLGADGGMFVYGGGHFYGSTGGMKLNKPVVGMALNASHTGYWEVASDGGIFSFNAGFYGSAGAIKLNQPIVGMAATPTGRGYWLVATDGGIFAYGDAQFYGSTGGMKLNQPIVGMAPTNDGKGYWLVASDGGVFAFGDAGFHGSTGSMKLNQSIIGITAAAYPVTQPFVNPGGYYLIAKDGGVFTFDASFYGSAAGESGRKGDAVGLSAPSMFGYSIATTSGQLYSYTYNNQPVNIGDASNLKLNAPMVGLAAD